MTPRHKTNQFRSLNWNQGKFDPPTEIKLSSIPQTEINSLSTTQTKTKSISMLTLKPSDLRPASKNQLNPHHHQPHKKQIKWPVHTKRVDFVPHAINFVPPHKKQVTFDSHTKPKSNSDPLTEIVLIATPLVKSSQMDPHFKSSRLRCLHTKTEILLIHTLNPSISRRPCKIQVNSDDHTEVK